MMFMSVRCHFHFNDCKEECQRAARQQRFGSPLSVRCWVLEAEGRNVSPLLLPWDGLILLQVSDVLQPKASMRWEPCCVWQPTNTRALITPSAANLQFWKINIDDLVKQAAQERGRTNNNRLYQCRQLGSMHSLVLFWWDWSWIPVAHCLTSMSTVSKRIWDNKYGQILSVLPKWSCWCQGTFPDWRSGNKYLVQSWINVLCTEHEDWCSARLKYKNQIMWTNPSMSH